MRRASAQLQQDRRAEILAAAERCFARSGFHNASMQEICAEAAMSPGNLYRYFDSKEAIIAGICERDRAEAARDFAAVDQAPDFFAALEGLARHHLIEEPPEKVALCTEIRAECRRNPAVAALYEAFEHDIKQRLAAMLRHAAERGEIARDLDVDGAVAMLMILSDGMSWRRATDPHFDAEAALPLILQMVRSLLTKPCSAVRAPILETVQ
jgi:AcrR family transcriptional regulator